VNVLFVMEDFCLGGVEKVTLNLIKSIHSEAVGRMSCAVAVQQDDGPLSAQFREQCMIFSLAKQSLQAVVKTWQPDAIVFTKGGLSRLATGEIRAMVPRLFAVQHVPINLPEYSFFKNTVRVIAAAFLYRRLNKVICVSVGIRDNLRRMLALSDSKLEVINNPVIDSNILHAAAEDGCEYENFFICVGRLHFQKGYDRLLQIVARVRTSVPELKIVILGDGPDREMLQASINAQGLATTVILHGNVENPYKYMARAKALLMTSRWEGLPTVLVEASALRVPIISFDCRYGPAEITDYGRHGYLISAHDEQAFARAIISVTQGVQPSIPDVTSYRYEFAARRYMELFSHG